MSNVLAICCEQGDVGLKRHSTLQLRVQGIYGSKEPSKLLEPNLLNFQVLPEYKSILKVDKNGVVEAIGCRGESGLIKITLKERKNSCCIVKIIVR